MMSKLLIQSNQTKEVKMRQNLFPVLLTMALLVAACAMPKTQLQPLVATIGKPTEVILYKVPT
jgi:hypothetical protein